MQGGDDSAGGSGRRSTPSLCDRGSIAAGGLYLAVSVLIFGRGLNFGNLAGSFIGRGSDPSLFMWALAWWPYSLSHRLNPILTDVIFAPGGFNLAWTTTIPLASVLMWPITASCGPIVSYNLLALAALPLAAWAAFVLCRYLTGSFWPALIGGYVFGFSSYFLAQLLGGHLHLVLVFPVPIALYFAGRWFDGAIGSRQAAWSIGLVLALQFLLSVEIFATASMFAGVAILIALVATAGESRRRVANMIGMLAPAYGVALLIASPLIYFLFAYGQPRGEIWSARLFSTDLLNFIVPTEVNQLGTLPLSNFYDRYAGNLFERDGYVGPVLIVLTMLFARRRWKEPFGKVVIGSLGVICALSLGPILQIAGRGLIAMPGLLLTMAPLMSKAVPARFMMFAFMAFAIIAADWLARSGASAIGRWAVAGAIVIFSLPNLNPGYWATEVKTPEFFARGLYRQYLTADENVLVTPYSLYGNSMLWQAQSGFYFRMAGGWTGLIPDEYKRWPLVAAITEWGYLPDAKKQMMGFLANHRVGAIVVGEGDPAHRFWPQWLAGITTPLAVGGVTLYRIAPEQLVPFETITGATAEAEAESAIFSGVLSAVSRYQREGRDAAALTPFALENLGLLPAAWNAGTRFDYELPRKAMYRGVWVGYLDETTLGIGIKGSYTGLKGIVDRYGGSASRIYFPFPHRFVPGARDAQERGLLLMFFDPGGLRRAIAANGASAPPPAPAISR